MCVVDAGKQQCLLCEESNKSEGSRSSPLSRTTYFFTEISFAAMIVSVARVATKANHKIIILSNELKRATSAKFRSSRRQYDGFCGDGAEPRREIAWDAQADCAAGHPRSPLEEPRQRDTQTHPCFAGGARPGLFRKHRAGIRAQNSRHQNSHAAGGTTAGVWGDLPV